MRKACEGRGAAGAGKHVFVEKPLALTPQGCDRIIEAAERAGVTLTVGHVLRFDPRYVTACQEIKKGTIGEPVHMFIRRNNSLASARRLLTHSSVLFFLGIHDIDLGCGTEIAIMRKSGKSVL